MLRLICLRCIYLVDQKCFREFMGEMGSQLGLILSETKVANRKQFGDISSNIMCRQISSEMFLKLNKR
jgi:hypothetical protein